MGIDRLPQALIRRASTDTLRPFRSRSNPSVSSVGAYTSYWFTITSLSFLHRCLDIDIDVSQNVPRKSVKHQEHGIGKVLVYTMKSKYPRSGQLRGKRRNIG